MTRSPTKALIAAAVLLLLSACGGGGGGPVSTSFNPAAPSSTPATTPTPLAAATLPPEVAQTVTLGGPVMVWFNEVAPGVSGTIAFPATTGATSEVALTFSGEAFQGFATPDIRGMMRPATLGAPVNPIAYLAVWPYEDVTFNAAPSFTLTFAPGILAGYAYVAFYNSANAAAGWIAVSGPVQASGTTLTIPSSSFAAATTLGATVGPSLFAIVENGTPLPTPTPVPTLSTSVRRGYPRPNGA